MGKIKPCTCGSKPGMMYNRMTDDSLFFFMKCKACGRRGKANADVNLAVDDWNEKQEEEWKNTQTERYAM